MFGVPDAISIAGTFRPGLPAELEVSCWVDGDWKPLTLRREMTEEEQRRFEQWCWKCRTPMDDRVTEACS